MNVPKKPGNFIEIGNARVDEQRDIMERIAHAKECPFCRENLEKYHDQPIIREGEHWIVTPNKWPYENTDLHLLAITTYHAEDLSDLREGAFAELQRHVVWASQEYRIAFGGLAMRFGNTEHTGATVSHLHAHLIVPKPDLSKEEKVRFKIS